MRLLAQRRDRARGQVEAEAATWSANSRGAWYPDPFEVADMRWWNGKAWTQQTSAADDVTNGSEVGYRPLDAEEAPTVQEISQTEMSEPPSPSRTEAVRHSEADTTSAKESSTEAVDTAATTASTPPPQAAGPPAPSPSEADECLQPEARRRWLRLNEAGAEQAVQERPLTAAQAREQWLPADAATLASHPPPSSSGMAAEIGDSTRWLPPNLTDRPSRTHDSSAHEPPLDASTRAGRGAPVSSWSPPVGS